MIFVLKMLNRIVLFFVFLGIFSASFAIGAEIQVSEEDSAILLEELDELIADIDAVGIFVHNASLSLPMFIPGFGVAWGLFSAYSTGFAYSAIAATNAEVAQLNPLAVLLTPFGLMEVGAYSIAMSRSTLLAKDVIRKNWNRIKNDKLLISIEIGVVVALLLIGGIVEMWMIETAQGIT